jgi:hypothetical protein
MRAMSAANPASIDDMVGDAGHERSESRIY